MAQTDMHFTSKLKIHFDDCDPAGIAFSGGIFTKMHRCYEEFIAALGENPAEFFLNNDLIVPIRHFEAEYFLPMRPFQEYEVWTQVLRISTSSFQLQYEIKKSERVHAVVRSTHVFCTRATMTKSPIPLPLKENLEKFVVSQ